MTVSGQRIRERERHRPRGPAGPAGPIANRQPPSAPGTTASGSAGGGRTGQHTRRSGFSWRPIAAVAVAAALAAAAYFGSGGGAAIDKLSDAEVQSRTAAYQTLIAGPGLPLTYVAPEKIDQAIAEMPPSVTSEQREQLRTEIDQGRTKLAWVTLWDTHAQDGDVLRFESSASFPIEVTALNAKTTIAIPYPADGKVLVTGVHDGGGGITIALESGATKIAWPTMAPGDTLDLPVTPSF